MKALQKDFGYNPRENQIIITSFSDKVANHDYCIIFSYRCDLYYVTIDEIDSHYITYCELL